MCGGAGRDLVQVVLADSSVGLVLRLDTMVVVGLAGVAHGRKKGMLALLPFSHSAGGSPDSLVPAGFVGSVPESGGCSSLVGHPAAAPSSCHPR